MDVKLPDGTIIQNVPEGISKADLVAKLKGNGYDTSGLDAPVEQKSTIGQDIKQGAGNLVAGAVRGAGSIGATLMAPIDMATDYIKGDRDQTLSSVVLGKKPLSRNEERRQQMDEALRSMGAETDSMLYKGGKIGAEIAGTAGAGGVVANGMTRAAPLLSSFAPSASNALANFAPVVQSGGLTLGANAPTNTLANLLLRAGGGAVNGAVSAGMVNPEDAGLGAAIGGAMPGAVKVAGVAGGMLNNAAAGLTKHVLGMSTGTGGNAVATAYKAGKDGATTFVDNMRGNVPMTDVLDSAKAALGQMRIDRATQYKNGMVDVSKDKTVIDFTPIDQAVASLKSMGNYKGQTINKNSAGVVDEISGLVGKWKQLDPAEFHTPEGLDALKQAISDIRDTTQFGTAARVAADKAYNAVKAEITAQAPVYSKVMKDYSEASATLSEIERALSLGNKAAADTSMRKLQSLMRNNVNTNFGNRLDLAKTLEQNGADILPAVAGQSMSSWTPRGMAGLAASGGAAGAMLTNPLAIAGLPITSPRLVGEAAYGLGAAGRRLGDAGNAVQSKLMQLLGNRGASQMTMNQLAPLLSTIAPVAAVNQR